MTPERWMRVKEVFHAAVEHRPAGRAAYLSAACGDDAALRAEVERLVRAHEEAATFIDKPLVAREATSAVTANSTRNSRALCLAVLGRYDDVVIEHVESAHQRAMILSRLGRYRDAARALADSEKEARANGDRSRQASVRLIVALLALERNNPEHALRETRSVEPLLATFPDNLERRVRVVTELITGLADLQARRQAQALAHFEAQGRVYTSSTEFERTWRHSLEGELALARGDLTRAATAFSAAEPRLRSSDWLVPLISVLVNQLPSRDGHARVALARGDLDGAIRMYRELLVYGPQSKWIAPMEPLYVLQLARLLEKKGDGKAALDEYQRFLRLWKNADADLPELAEARRAVKRLEAAS